MKRFFKAIAAFAVAYPKAAKAGSMLLLGAGGAVGIAMLVTPTIVPFTSSNFNPNQSGGATNNGLKPNGGTDGAMRLPTNAPDSAAYYFEMVVNPNLPYSQGITAPFVGAGLNTNTLPGAPNFYFQRLFSGIANIPWLLNTGATFSTGGSVTAGSNYSSGFYPFTAPSTGCIRAPSAVWSPGNTPAFQQVDPGLGCPTGAATLNATQIAANVPGLGAQQSTGAGSVATTCVSNSPVSGEMTVTAHVAVAHGVYPGIQYTLQGFTTQAGYNATYTALPGTTGTTLVGETTTGGGTCPTSPATQEGTALLGTGGSITFPSISATGPYTAGSTGIAVHNNQHICAWLGENGDDSAFPGSQFLEMVDEKGNAVSGSPMLVPFLNQGTGNWTGFITTGAQPSFTVTALNSYSITAASFNASTGFATFTLSSNPGYVSGSEFTVSGATTSGGGSFNLTYVAVTGTSGTTIVANPLSGPAGTPAVSSLTGSSTASTGAMASVVLQGANIFGAANGSIILPYGTGGSSGTGGVGTYNLTLNQTGYTFTISAVNTGTGQITVTGSPAQLIVMGTTFTVGGNTFVVTSFGTGTGGAGTYIVNSGVGTSLVTGTATASGAIWSSGTPGTIAATSLFYHNPAGTNANLSGMTAPGRTGASISDFISVLGTSSASVSGAVKLGWGGALGNFATLYGPLPLQSGGAPSTADLASICTKTTDIAKYAQTKSLTVHSLYRMNDPGIWGDSSVADFTGDITGTTLHIDSTQYGATTALPATTVISGPGITGCPATCPTISSGSGTSYVLSASGGVVAAEAMKAGTFKPALPIQSNTMKGYIDTTGSVSTLHVMSLDDGTTHSGFASFTGALSGTAGGPLTTLTVSGVTGTLQAGMVITDGGANITGSPLLIVSGSGTTWTVAGNYYPTISAEAMTATLTTLVPGEYIQNSAITNPVKIVAYSSCGMTGTNNGLLGCYTLSGSPNASNAVGSVGSQVVFTGTTITDGGAIAPGPALTIADRGPAITFPLTNISAVKGTLSLSGTYDTATLGGTPSGIQVLVSNSANGPPLAGCTPCNWGTLSGTIAAGKWSGTLAGVPGGGPYIVSVRAANGTAYATLPNSVKVGWIFALWGQGQADSIQGAQSGSYTSFFPGLWGSNGWASSYSGLDLYLQGPAIVTDFVPGRPTSSAGDRFGVQSNGQPLSEAVSAFDQALSGAYSSPTSFFSATRDGVGIGIATLGNSTQTQTVDVGDGSTLAFCSASTFCASAGVSPAGQLVYGAASLTGGWFSGASISGTTFTAGTRVGGALEPGLVLNTPLSPVLVRCLTGCSSQMNFGSSTWLLSTTDTGTPTRADPVGGAPWPNLNIQGNGLSGVYAFAGFGVPLIKTGTFSVSVNGTVVCQDSSAFAYNQTGGNCTGANIDSTKTFVNYQTGDYQITFTSGHAPGSGAAIIASWTNIISPEVITSASLSKPQGIDFFGDSSGPTSGADANLFSKAPGGVNGHIFSGEGTDKTYMLNNTAPSNVGYQYGGIGYSQMVSWLYSTKFPALIPGASANVDFITTGQWRIEGPTLFSNSILALDGVHDQWTQDVATQSLLSGSVASSVLTLSATTTFPMWEGEVLDCVTLGGGCTIGPLSGIYITGLTGGTWGASGSTYSLAGASGVTSTGAMQNPVFYSGPGQAFYAGTLNDVTVQNSGLAGTTGRQPHTWLSFAGGRRATSRWAAMIYGNAPGNATPATDPKVDRVKADAVGCDSAALAAPCLDIGSGAYNATSTASWSPTGNTVTITGGLAAHARPFVVGMNTFCSGCNTGLIITSVSAPPTQSTVSGQGQVGNTFTFTVKNSAGQAIGGTGSGSFAGGCFGTSGTGANCIDIAISLNVSGTFGTSAALATCGANNLNGAAPNYSAPFGVCSDNGIGEIVRTFRIGTNQLMYGNGANGPSTGSVFDDGVDIANGSFTQSAAFTCNIVAAAVVQCVKGPAYASGVFSSVGQWPSGTTYVSYGDLTVVSGRLASLLGYVGGQSFPFTAGSGYTNGTTSPTVTCTTLASGGSVPKFDVTVAGGAIVNVVPSASGSASPGLGIGSTCTVALPAGGSGGAIATIPLAPNEGQGGIGTYNTDTNTMGMFLYDNSGFPGNPLNQFFTNGMGGYFEPGLPVRPFGEFQGLQVSSTGGGSCSAGASLQFNLPCNTINIVMKRA